MKIKDLVSIRIKRNHRVTFGILTEIDMAAGVGVVMANGVRYVRSLKRIKPSATGRREAAVKIRRDIKRGKVKR